MRKRAPAFVLGHTAPGAIVHRKAIDGDPAGNDVRARFASRRETELGQRTRERNTSRPRRAAGRTPPATLGHVR